MSDAQPNIVVFFWDNFGWGELGCYGGGVLRGAPTPRIDKLAGEGLKLPNFNVEAQCTPSRSAILTGRHPIRSGTQVVPIGGGPDGLTRWEVGSRSHWLKELRCGTKWQTAQGRS
jgi:arylsulfatase